METLRYGVFNIDAHWWVYGAQKWSGPFDTRDGAVAMARREIQQALNAGLDVELDIQGADGELTHSDLATLPIFAPGRRPSDPPA